MRHSVLDEIPGLSAIICRIIAVARNLGRCPSVLSARRGPADDWTRVAGRREHLHQGTTSADPPKRKKIHRESAALNGLHAHIDAMTDADPCIALAAPRRRARHQRRLPFYGTLPW